MQKTVQVENADVSCAAKIWIAYLDSLVLPSEQVRQVACLMHCSGHRCAFKAALHKLVKLPWGTEAQQTVWVDVCKTTLTADDASLST